MFEKEALLYDSIHQDKDYYKEALAIKKKYPRAKTILEIGSGTGLMTKELIKLGFKVTIIEPSTSMFYIAYINNRLADMEIFHQTIQNFESKIKYDLVLALYDVLNYVPHSEYENVIKKIKTLGKRHIIELWNHKKKIQWFTYKSVVNLHRIRLGLRFKQLVFLVYIYFGTKFCIEFHKLFLHSYE